DDEPLGVEEKIGAPGHPVDGVAGDPAFDPREREAVVARADDLAVLDPDAAPADEMHETATAAGQRTRPAVEDEAGEHHMICLLCRNQRGTVGAQHTACAPAAPQ